jgi:hypothetical protein
VRDSAFARRLHGHASSEQALRVLGELMVTAQDARSYEHRRKAFLRLVRDDTPASGFVARILRYFAVTVPTLPFDDRDTLVHAILDHSDDTEALVLFLLAMTDQPNCVRPILDRIPTRQNPFPMLARLLAAAWLEPFHHILAANLIDAARARHGALRNWVREEPDKFFQPEVFGLLFEHGAELIAGLCKEILVDGPDEHRDRLVHELEANGTETALRLLILGLPFGGRRCDAGLLAAIGSFNHELAVAALRDVVHCGNLADEHVGDAMVAIKALKTMDNDDSREFLDEVVTDRFAMLPTYKRELRRGARKGEGE